MIMISREALEARILRAFNSPWLKGADKLYTTPKGNVYKSINAACSEDSLNHMRVWTVKKIGDNNLVIEIAEDLPF